MLLLVPIPGSEPGEPHDSGAIDVLSPSRPSFLVACVMSVNGSESFKNAFDKPSLSLGNIFL